MNYTTDINDRPWNAIRNGTKDIEIRTNTPFENIDYSQLKKGDIFKLINNETGKVLETRILRISHYRTVKELLEKEGTERTLSSGKDLEGGIESIRNIKGYKEAIPKCGIWAIELELKF